MLRDILASESVVAVEGTSGFQDLLLCRFLGHTDRVAASRPAPRPVLGQKQGGNLALAVCVGRASDRLSLPPADHSVRYSALDGPTSDPSAAAISSNTERSPELTFSPSSSWASATRSASPMTKLR